MSLFDPDVEYTITSVKNDKYILDVSQGASNRGALIIYHKNQQKNQRFRIVYNHGWYSIINCLNNEYLSINNNSDKSGSKVYASKNEGLQGQAWQFESCPEL